MTNVLVQNILPARENHYVNMLYADALEDQLLVAAAEELYEYLIDLRDALEHDDYVDVLEYVLFDDTIDLDADLKVIAESIEFYSHLECQDEY